MVLVLSFNTLWPFCFAIILMWKRELLYFNCLPDVFCSMFSVTLLLGAVGWTMVCDCGLIFLMILACFIDVCITV